MSKVGVWYGQRVAVPQCLGFDASTYSRPVEFDDVMPVMGLTKAHVPIQIPPSIEAFGIFTQEPCDLSNRRLDPFGLFVLQTLQGVSRCLSQGKWKYSVDQSNELLQSTSCGASSSPVKAIPVGSKVRFGLIPSSMHLSGGHADLAVVEKSLPDITDIWQKVRDGPAVDRREPGK
ncbi:hypothetical protein IX27_01810 [Streptomyces sp. JS01]|nr:hypothetical protein IX27_01810 [Streptomyces sp. JS01]